MMACVLVLTAGLLGAPKDYTPLELSDAGPYRLALNALPTGKVVRVGFRDLWDHPDRYRGRPIQVQGQVERVFSQPAFETFPPLAEVWVVSPHGDPFCLVCPAQRAGSGKMFGQAIRFTGTFLKLVRFQAGDKPRLAPLIVGPAPPVVMAAPARAWTWSWSPQELAIAAILAAFAGLLLAGRHLRRPVRRDRRAIDPTDPNFLHNGSQSPSP